MLHMRKTYLMVVALVTVLIVALFTRTSAERARGSAIEAARSAVSGSGTHTPPSSQHSGGSPTQTGASFYTPTKLKPGEKPPQFIVLSFDGSGWHEKWQYWNGIASKVPLRWTAFLTGLYLLDAQHRDAYQGPGHAVGASSLGSFNTAGEVVTEVKDLNAAYKRGVEIGTHFNGHFCSDNRPGGNDWSTADWDSELRQFFHFVRSWKTIDRLPTAPSLDVPASSITAERTPCLEGQPGQLFPALRSNGFTVDSTVVRRGLSWPVRQDGIWQMGMTTFPLAGTQHFVTTMDYNFWYTQEGASSHVPAAASAKDGAQIERTYLNMYHAAYDGNRAPLILGNHFESWSNNAYTTALANFALRACGQPNTYCVPFRDVVRWMNLQDPSTLARLQALPAELGPPAG
ncbi:MAG: polysaccharide deacetylase [Mycobacteriales bacterium]